MAAPVRVNLAEAYHEDSKYSTHLMPRLGAGLRTFEDWVAAQPLGRRPCKAYPGVPVTGLPRPKTLLSTLGGVLASRRSKAPGPGAATARQLATLLWAGQGMHPDGHRTAPSAGALYPLEIYVLAHAVRGVPSGVHHYDPMRHVLEQVGTGQSRAWYVEEGRFDGAALHIAIAAVLPRLGMKYRERAYRLALQEAGHAAQNILLAAEALRLAAVPVGGFFDDRVHDDLDLDGVEEVVLTLLPAGKPTRARP